MATTTGSKDAPTPFAVLATTSAAVAATTKRSEKVAAIAAALAALDADEVEPATAFLVGETRLGRIGVGWAAIADIDAVPAADPTLTILDVDRAIAELAVESGPGSTARRGQLLARLFGAATADEQQLLRGILGGELRQGALDGVMVSAVAAAAGAPVAAVRRAAMFTGATAAAARIALVDGRAALDSVSLRPLQPVAPMLAATAATVAEAVGDDGVPVLVEWKLDGARVQVHRRGETVKVFTRNLNDVTERLLGVAAMAAELPGGDLVLDGEAIGLLDDGAPQRFQDTISEFSRDDAAPLHAFFFDALHVDGRSIHDDPLAARRLALSALVPPAAMLPSITTADPAEAQRFFDDAVDAGQEGVVVKDLAAPYEAGRRGAAWRKVKPVHTYDLVVLAVEWGHGRRRGWLSNLHLGARDPDSGDQPTFLMVGKTFKGLTDELLAWQTTRFQELAVGTGTGRESNVVYVRPEQVVEVAIDGVQVSPRYPGGVALRFARVRRYRDDKSPEEADTIDALRALL